MAMPALGGPSWGAPKPSVVLRCPRCRRAAPCGQKFCCGCGAPLGRRCERKQVTVLFTDVSGFTAMAERLDPEDVRAILERAFEIISDAVHAHGGTINQFLGDGVMALFGEAAGDDAHAERAVRTALAIEAALAPLRRDVRRAHGVGFLVRVGVHTGPVVVGVIGAGLRSDYVPQGETTSVAARLVSIAPAGEVLVSADTRESLNARFLLQEFGQVSADASAAPVRAWTVVGELRERVEADRESLAEV
jgi:class 3 adenylate cyclase